MNKTEAFHSTKTSTMAVHGGTVIDPHTHASSPNLVMSSTFSVPKPEGFSAYDLNEHSPYIYTRWANPTIRMLEQKIVLLEGAEAGACFASGMAAFTSMCLSLLKAGDHVVVSDVCYAGISEFVNHQLPGFGIEVDRANLSDPTGLERVLRANTRLVHIETPVNPLTRVTDISAIVDQAHSVGALVSADNTFATPIGTRPLEFNVDLVMHSATKYLCGHGDAMGGVVVGSSNLIQQIVGAGSVHLGGVISPFNAWLIARGVSTLPIRMKAHEANAIQVAKFLEAHSSVAQVNYPGLRSHPQHELARRQMNNFSGMISFQVRGSEEIGAAMAARMASDLKFIHYAVSLGHAVTLITWMQTSSLLENSYPLEGPAKAAYQDFAGNGLFRLSVGLEDPEDLCKDLDAVLSS